MERLNVAWRSIRPKRSWECNMRSRWPLALACASAFAVTGCASIGPATIKRDRTDYSSAMASSWKEQMLLNIVKFRYFDPPVFLDVSSVISSQELYTQADASVRLFPHPVSTSQEYRNIGVTGRYTDRPTVSYTPITGDRFINSLLRPIPPQTIFAMIDAGHDAGFIFSLAVRSINGIYNYSASPARARSEDPKFRQVSTAIRRIQQAGAIGTRTGKIGTESVIFVFFRRNAGQTVEQEIRLLKRLLGLEPGRDQFVLTFGSSHKAGEIAVLTRSMQEILTELAAGVEVPEEDVAELRATSMPILSTDAAPRPLIRIHSGAEQPTDSFSAVPYRDRWFWIDDRDLRSKRVFMFLMIFSALSESRAVPQVPIVTIPASR